MGLSFCSKWNFCTTIRLMKRYMTKQIKYGIQFFEEAGWTSPNHLGYVSTIVAYVSRWVIAFAFILSGLLKTISLKTFEQVVELYGNAYLGDVVISFSREIAITFCFVEIIIGMLILTKRFCLASSVMGTLMLLFFVYLTGVNLFFPSSLGRLEGCACFGEIIHFTPISSFLKSFVLLSISFVNMCFLVRLNKKNIEDVENLEKSKQN